MKRPESATRTFYGLAIAALTEVGVPFLVGGAFAFERYTGIIRRTKDLDLFVRPEDLDRALAALGTTGCTTDRTFPHWLAKAVCGEDFIDIIFNSGNGQSPVDDAWFDHALAGEVLGVPVQICPAEETLWTKAFIMERERYDGADIAHLIRARGESLDWRRLIDRFGDGWRVLLAHLCLFGFIYPSEPTKVPVWVMRELLDRLETELSQPPAADRVCRGTLLSRAQYLIDIDQWGYHDGRVQPRGQMSPGDTAHWTAAIGDG